MMESIMLVILIAGPTIISMLLYLFIQLTNTYFIGHLNDKYLIAGVGMGNMLINLFCFAVQQGLNGALDTFVSKAVGARLYRVSGNYLNRARVI
jgi:Na+-driven multidrug efflux pump